MHVRERRAVPAKRSKLSAAATLAPPRARQKQILSAIQRFPDGKTLTGAYLDGGMKVGFATSFVSRLAGGMYDALRFLAQALHAPPRRTVQVFGISDPQFDADRAGWGGVPAQAFAVKGPMAFGYAPQMPAALDAAGLDLLHLHGLWMYPSVATMGWGKRNRRPYIVSPHGMLDPWALRNSRPKKIIARTLYENRNLRGAAALQAGSESEYHAIRAAGFRNPVFILANGIHLPAPPPANDHPPWNGAVRRDAKVLLYLGRIHPKKGLTNLLHAWRDARSAAAAAGRWDLVIAGEGPPEYEAELRRLAESLSLTDSVHFVGPQYHEAKLACYRHSSAFILPSFSEGLPMVVLDAWSHALPVLMTPQCNLPVGFDAGAAVRVEPEVASITQGLVQVMTMPDDRRAALGQRGRALAGERFTWDAIAAEMSGVYEWALGRGDRPAIVRID